MSKNAGSYIEVLMQTFAPAKNEIETTHWFSTDEVFEAIKRIDPGTKTTKDDIYDSMMEAGFRYQCRPGAMALDFKWMLKAK